MSPRPLFRRLSQVPVPVWPVLAVLVVVGAVVLWPGGGGTAPAAASRDSADAGTAGDTVTAAGTVQSADTRELAFGASGTVEALRVRVGSKVKAGQLLARIDDTRAREDLLVAEAALAAAIEARDQPSTGQGGSGSGQTGCTTTTAVTPRATASPSSTPTPRPTATRTSRPTAAPTPTPSPSTPGNGGGNGGGNGCSGGGSNGSNGSGGSSARSAVQAEAQVTQAESRVKEARRALLGTRLTAPTDATVLAVAGTVGTQVSGAGSSGFITLGDLTELQVEGMFSQSDLARLEIGQAAEITLPVRPGEKFTGEVVHIDPAATADGDLVRYGVKIAFDDSPTGLLAGMNAGVTVTP